ncbi:alpha-amylase family glycosyl hydrolase [Treponema sp.]|uniref:alpha-amylase family glycosyl hydrolase n=1 Tax=Treponema sp. TaxID=166 RepID=UPI00298D7EC9|nr:alpha-amylase family glycosyl hydrolase [Treponema sp.]MCQ2241677.1 alpha-amylase family glycosyl hydrolase [Treponema sp.]
MNAIFSDKFFYHIYPLGMGNCPRHNDYQCPPGNFFEILTPELDRIHELGVNALYIGPIFESTSHGYDTLDYFYVDRRLGNNEKFKDFCRECHNRGISVILDAVFNHTGREFFAFKDLIKNGTNSSYKDWYLNINFDGRSCFGDNFDYDGWAGCKDLVKLNGENPAVQDHLFSAVKFWIEEFGIDGLRLDAADVLSPVFMDRLSSFCKSIKDDFWLMGEVVNGDYNNWAKPGRLDSVTNYQIYKGIWSSINDKNLFELSYNLNREFGPNGIYRYSPLYNFVDNHDVNRIGSTLKDCCSLHLLYGILFTIPGIPSIYYGSELGIKGCRGQWDDFQLRPALPPFVERLEDFCRPDVDSTALVDSIKRFAKIRQENSVLQKGDYREISVSNQQFAFSRQYEGQEIIVCINIDSNDAKMDLHASNQLDKNGIYTDLLNGGEFKSSTLSSLEIPSKWLRILKRI